MARVAPAASSPHSDRPPRAPPRRTDRATPRWQIVLAGLALFALALVPRLVGAEQHLTADDQDWMRRTIRFSLAVQRGSLRETYQSGHPGVPVLWLASLAMGPQRLAELRPLVGNVGALEKAPAYLPALSDIRRTLALASAGLTVLLAFLAWRLFGTGPGLLAGLLLAGEPFLVAHSRLFHTDPLLAQLMAVSILAALVFYSRGGWEYLVGSGLAAGLAFLTKAPGVFLFGFVPLLGLAWTWRLAGRLGPAEVRPLVLPLALWGLAAGAVYVLLWPALWVDPFGTLNRMALAVRGVGESPRRWGNFFLGQVVPEDAGPLFYFVVTPLRLSPITLVGMLLLGGLATSRSARQQPGTWRAVEALVAALSLFTIMMTLSPKKLDRYLLPAYPMLGILAAVGLWLGLRQWLEPHLRWAAVLALGLAQMVMVMSVQPYPLSFFNPLLGGISVARQVMIVGWGEGTDQVAAYLDQQPNAADIVATSLYHDLINTQSRATGVPLWEWQRAEYLADYVNMDQRGLVPGPLQELVRTQPPVFTARINGLDYVRLYPIPAELRAEGGADRSSRGARVPRP